MREKSSGYDEFTSSNNEQNNSNLHFLNRQYKEGPAKELLDEMTLASVPNKRKESRSPVLQQYQTYKADAHSQGQNANDNFSKR